eukprot:CAMPEP_0119302948 /NCGR_PEP_ID=MMETSP1333-20130426/4462_1 /TAXON_ID=418940 /ORGANISM="Scyphosphaera apsteinii, Strain RCC1455" /LENGTH=197 /DNA_ID=CAMNT_0007305475 /DNA_START=107 /DNA_END=700 /DNA_ORIENTATION=+
MDVSERGGIGTLQTGRQDGLHGTGYHFMPMTAMPNEPSPALVAIAGAYPGLSAQQLLAPQPLPLPEQGRWNYHRLIADGLPGGFVAVPGSSLLVSSPNTVAVVCSSESLGIELADGAVYEVLALIDRSDPATTNPSAMSPKHFYAFSDTDEVVHIRWIEALPQGWRVLGKLLYTQIPFVKRPGSGGGFAEMDDDFEF